MSEQSKMVSEILTKCYDQPEEKEKVMVRSTTVDVCHRKKRKESKSKMEIEHIMKVQPEMASIKEVRAEKEMTQGRFKNVNNKPQTNFVKGSLENARGKYMRDKKVLKELIE